MTRRLSDDGTRMVDDAPSFAIAAYDVTKISDEQREGRHVGVFTSAEDAESWLATGEPSPRRLFSGEITRHTETLLGRALRSAREEARDG